MAPAASDACVDPIAAEARAALRSGIGTAVVGRDDLDVLHLPLSVRPLVLDSYVRKVNVAVDDRKVSTRCPFRHVTGRSIAITLGAAALAIEIAQEALIVALQLVVERDSLYRRAAAAQAFCRVHVSAIQL